MIRNVLCVDDDAYILDGFRRQLGRTFDLVTALGAEQGLNTVMEKGPFAVVVSDLRMPKMDGIEFLTKVRSISPDTVRILLTGNADLQTAMDAINRGEIFRFLTKPCETSVLSASLAAGIEQHRLITTEKLLLEQTLTGSIKVLCEVLALVNPEAFGRSSRIVRLAEAIAHHLSIEDVWPIKTAAMLSQIGCVILPEDILKKLYCGIPLSPQDEQLYHQHPYVAGDLLSKIPRMEHVARIIALQDKCLDDTQPTGQAVADAIPLEARILKVALDFDTLESTGLSKTAAFHRLKQRKRQYDHQVVEALKLAFAEEIKYEVKSSVVSELTCGMVLAEDIKSSKDVLLASKGLEVNPSTILRLQNFKQTGGVREPFLVLDPIRLSADAISDSTTEQKIA